VFRAIYRQPLGNLQEAPYDFWGQVQCPQNPLVDAVSDFVLLIAGMDKNQLRTNKEVQWRINIRQMHS
jgi:hypothetical protein